MFGEERDRQGPGTAADGTAPDQVSARGRYERWRFYWNMLVLRFSVFW